MKILFDASTGKFDERITARDHALDEQLLDSAECPTGCGRTKARDALLCYVCWSLLSDEERKALFVMRSGEGIAVDIAMLFLRDRTASEGERGKGSTGEIAP